MTTTLNPLRNARNIGTGGGGDLEPIIEQLEEDVERALQGSHVYSTTEKVVGEWIDGQPIYERTIELEESVTLDSSNLSRFVELSEVGLNASDILSIAFYGNNTITTGSAEIDSSYIWARALTSITCTAFTIQYLR